MDINDEPVKFVKREQSIEIDENDGHWSSGMEQVLLKLQVNDADTLEVTEHSYRIVDQRIGATFYRFSDHDISSLPSGIFNKNYSDFFRIKSSIDGGQLLLIRPVDFERPSQRFIALRILVSDNGFRDRRHVDQCFVYIKIRDINDNSPVFSQESLNITTLENTALGTILTKFQATDADQGGHAPVMYFINSDTNRAKHFSVDSEGFIRLVRPLDRETLSHHRVDIVAIDDSERTATVSLFVTVEDVNDNAPELVQSPFPVVMENQSPGKVAELYAFDKDDYSKGIVLISILVTSTMNDSLISCCYLIFFVIQNRQRAAVYVLFSARCVRRNQKKVSY